MQGAAADPLSGARQAAEKSIIYPQTDISACHTSAFDPDSLDILRDIRFASDKGCFDLSLLQALLSTRWLETGIQGSRMPRRQKCRVLKTLRTTFA